MPRCRPFPYAAVKKEDEGFNFFIEDLLSSSVDLHRCVRNMEWVEVPDSASATGSPGMMAYDDDYIYICTDNNTWKRVAISTW